MGGHSRGVSGLSTPSSKVARMTWFRICDPTVALDLIRNESLSNPLVAGQTNPTRPKRYLIPNFIAFW